MIRLHLKTKIDEIKDQQVVIDWIDKLSDNSKSAYLRALGEFCLVNGKTPQELLDIVFKENEARNPPWEQSNKDWFNVYETHCVKNNRSKATRDGRIGMVKAFFHYYELPTPKFTNRRTKKNKLKIKNKRPALKKVDIKKALDACQNVRLKALILTQASSGLSLADVVNIKIKDFYQGLIEITDGKEICKLHLNREKNDNEFTTFLSYEAVDAIRVYISTERRFESECLFQKEFLTKRDLDPNINDNIILMEYRVLNRRLNYKQKIKGKFRPYTTHMMRKFFSTQLSNSGMGYEPRKHMMGHIIPGVDNSYYLDNQDELMELYIQYMHKITINPTKILTIETKEYKELKEQLDENEKENKIKEDRITKLEKRVQLMESLDHNAEFKEKHP